MEGIFTDTQIHGYPLMVRSLTLIAILLFSYSSLSQTANLSSRSKKAIKLYEKSNDLLKQREFDGAILSLQKSLKIDGDFYEASLKLAGIFRFLRLLDSADAYFVRYFEMAPPERVDNKTLFELAHLFFSNGDYSKADEVIKRLEARSVPFTAYENELLRSSIDFSLMAGEPEVPLEMSLLPRNINQFRLQYFPVLTIDNQTLIYTRRKGIGPYDDEDIVIAQRRKGEWQPSESISEEINTPYNEGACTISADGRTLIFTSCEGRRSFGSCDLFISTKSGMVWSKPQNMGSTVNSIFWESQPSLSADGKTLYFSSNRPGGAGERDIWVTYFNGKVWQRPINLGKNVNTPKDETTPFIHVNGETLFLSSNGHPGFGGYDLFLSELSDSTWSKPNNLGNVINDNNDQISLFITADGTTGYFALEENSGRGIDKSELYQFTLPTDTLVHRKTAYVTGRIRDKITNRPLEASLQLYDLNSNQVKYATESDPISGVYFFALTQGLDYGAYVKKDGYLFEDFHFSVGESSALSPDTVNILLTPVRTGEKVVLENIYFEFDSYHLSSRSFSELEIVKEFLQENDLIVEVSGHTDDRGSATYNNTLSFNRAKAVYDYLMGAGVDDKKLRYKGYGASQPISANDSEAGRRKNRRIEFLIVE
ncbi:MAG: PD40 domain-containing protein [Cyclobacteriaceae bacterium]|nr:PD40 domain-containing protein [Cyclobacteriaceae bacterium HetDA_MAG_MS6]